MTSKAKELLDNIEGVLGNSVPQHNESYFEETKQIGLIIIERNIKIFSTLINRMDDFPNESRQIIYQLIDNETEVKQEIEKL
jgi:hypothetical protein